MLKCYFFAIKKKIFFSSTLADINPSLIWQLQHHHIVFINKYKNSAKAPTYTKKTKSNGQMCMWYVPSWDHQDEKHFQRGSIGPMAKPWENFHAARRRGEEARRSLHICSPSHFCSQNQAHGCCIVVFDSTGIAS